MPHGGQRKGAGRPEIDKSERAVKLHVSVSREQYETLLKLSPPFKNGVSLSKGVQRALDLVKEHGLT